MNLVNAWKNKKSLLLWVIIGCLSCGIMVGCRGACDSLFYHPTLGKPEITEILAKTYDIREVYFTNESNQKLYGWFLKSKIEPAKGTIVHCHGNTGTVDYHEPVVGWLSQKGYHVVMFDFRGFGASEGKASLQNMREDTLCVLENVAKMPEVQGKPLMLYGQSLGGAIAVYAAGKTSVKLDLLILGGTFGSFPHIAKKIYPVAPMWLANWLVSSDGDPIMWAKQVKCPVFQAHSREDRIVPFECGALLKGCFVMEHFFLEVRNKKHLYEVMDSPWREIFLDYLDQIVLKHSQPESLGK